MLLKHGEMINQHQVSMRRNRDSMRRPLRHSKRKSLSQLYKAKTFHFMVSHRHGALLIVRVELVVDGGRYGLDKSRRAAIEHKASTTNPSDRLPSLRSVASRHQIFYVLYSLGA